MSSTKKAAELKKFIRFGIVGAIGSIIDFGIFNLLASVIGLSAVLSSVISFSVAVINNFIWNRLWTFPETRNKPVAKQLTQFIIVSLAGLAIRTPLFAWLEKLLIPLAEKNFPNLLTPTIVGHNLALAVVIGVVLLWNYFINKLWTFKTPSNTMEESNGS